MAYKTQNRERSSDRFASPEEYVGYGLCDPQGREIGRVRKLYLNDYDEPEYIEVKMGLFSRKLVLIPVTGVALDEGKKTSSCSRSRATTQSQPSPKQSPPFPW